ncbi:hypothetical protein CSB11_01590 [Candidatus Campbellbacteria bacterium]|nr:MAG: hypothetical protein CSB11_01590 [Candidatus Campbellbacteria bacterium]
MTKTISLKKIILKNKKNILIFTIPLIILIIVSSFTGRYLEEVPKNGGSITEIIIGKNPRNVNPVLATSKTDKDILPLIYSTVLKINQKQEIVPNIADFKISEDSKTYTLTIKENVKFSNGDLLTSDDIIFTIEKIQDPLIQSPYFSEWIDVETEKIDQKNLKIILPKEYDQFKNTLANLYILPKKLWQDITPAEFPFFELNNHPIGSGPFKIDKTTRDDQFGKIKKYVLKRNPYYFDKKAYLDEVNLVVFNNLEAYKKSLLYSNEKVIKNIFAVPPEEISQFVNQENDSKYGVQNLNSTRIFGLFLSPKNQNLSSLKAREAISKIINREKIVKENLSGYAKTTNSPLYFDTFVEQKTDKKDIEKLFKEAGYQKNDQTNILTNSKTKKEFRINLAVLNSEEFKNIASEISKSLTEYGIGVNITHYTNNDLIQNVIRPRSFDMALYGYQTSVIPDYYFLFHSSQIDDPQINISKTNNKKIDQAVADLRKVIPKQEREKKYQVIKEEIQKENLFIPIYSPDYIYIVDKRVKGFERKTIDSRELRFSDINNWYVNIGNIISF